MKSVFGGDDPVTPALLSAFPKSMQPPKFDEKLIRLSPTITENSVPGPALSLSAFANSACCGV
jgi:hypothetical protein